MSINIRRASSSDLMKMQNCNLSCLPENYHLRYYLYHHASWPEVSYVAEDRKNHVVGYILAKMEDNYESIKIEKDKVPNGHITSISIFRTCRKLKVATKLMRIAHRQLKDVFKCEYVSLHVRKSNTAAIHMYTKTFGYRILDVEQGYYNDGEDALKLRKTFGEKIVVPKTPSEIKEEKQKEKEERQKNLEDLFNEEEKENKKKKGKGKGIKKKNKRKGKKKGKKKRKKK